MKNQRGDKSTTLASRVQLLERELTDKTDLLERTAKSLADSQRQYKKLLEEMERLKLQINVSATTAASNKSFESSNSINSSSFLNISQENRKRNSTNNRHNFQRSIDQLKNVEGNVQNLSLQNSALKAKVEHLNHEQSEWNHFAISAYKEISNFVNFNRDFPEDDSDAQRFILLDLIRKLTKRCSSDLPDGNLAHKYTISKLKLQQVQKKCDRMLQLLGERGYDTTQFKHIASHKNIHKSSTKSKHLLKESKSSDSDCEYNFKVDNSFAANRYDSSDNLERSSDDCFDHNEWFNRNGRSKQQKTDLFKSDVKKLIGVTKNMKGHYRNYAHLSKKLGEYSDC